MNVLLRRLKLNHLGSRVKHTLVVLALVCSISCLNVHPFKGNISTELNRGGLIVLVLLSYDNSGIKKNDLD